MADMQVRGYMVMTTLNFLCQSAADRGLPDPREHFSPALRASLADFDPQRWYPVAHVSELNRLIVSLLAEDNEERARAELAMCGRAMANEATSTFMRLIMRVLTPMLFARKLPDLWHRDCQHGRLSLTVEEHMMTLRLYDMRDHTHVAAVMPGFVGFALEKMGKVLKTVTITGWSLEKPSEADSVVEFYWQN